MSNDRPAPIRTVITADDWTVEYREWKRRDLLDAYEYEGDVGVDRLLLDECVISITDAEGNAIDKGDLYISEQMTVIQAMGEGIRPNGWTGSARRLRGQV